jgi:hydroxymethylpyrimidine pyrophosphatase-like HAD family hydrolase
MIKLIACDLDGTLLPKGEKRLAAEVERDIKAFISAGGKFAVVSGRDYPSLMRVFDFRSDEIYYVCCGGSVCIKGGKTLYSKPVSAESVIAAIKAAKNNGKGLVLCSDKVVYVYGSADFVAYVKRLYGDDAVEIHCNRGVLLPVYKISFFGETEKKSLEPNAVGLKLFYNRNGWEEYVSRIAGKMEAFSDLRMRLGILASETVAAGDDLCDVGMLSRAGRAYAFTPEAADAAGAEYVTDPHRIFGN